MIDRFPRDGSRCLTKLAAWATVLLLPLGLAACAGDESPSPATSLSDEDAPATAASELCGGQPEDHLQFDMVRSSAAANARCLEGASGYVTVRSLGPVEEMTVQVRGLPPFTGLDFFVIQVPNAPFGLSWYQGDIETDENGRGEQRFIGRFNIETFIVAPGVAPAPVVHDEPPFPDASSNPKTAPVHTFHLGLWFNSPDDAAASGCPSTVTPFNGDHTAGIQVLSTRNFPDGAGPLSRLE